MNLNKPTNTPENDVRSSRPAWMDDELVKHIPQQKLDFAAMLFENGHGKSQKDMMRTVLPLMKKAKAENLIFSQTELSACIQAIKKYSTPEELAKIDELLNKNQGHPS